MADESERFCVALTTERAARIGQARFRFTDTFVKDNGQGRLYAGHVTKARPPVDSLNLRRSEETGIPKQTRKDKPGRVRVLERMTKSGCGKSCGDFHKRVDRFPICGGCDDQQAGKAFWALLKNYPKQSRCRFSRRAKPICSLSIRRANQPELLTRRRLTVDGLWAKIPGESSGRTILYFFGGGYMVGTPATRRKTAGHLALAAGAQVLVPNYRLAPEHPFPAAVEDAVRAYQWLLDQGRQPPENLPGR